MQLNTTIVGKNFTVGGKIQYQCPKGHSLVGNGTRTCRENGLWSSFAPSCKCKRILIKFVDKITVGNLYLDVECGQLKPLQHGAIILSENRTTFGVQATYTCHENYTLIGHENRTCGLEGWTGEMPQCLVDWCPEPPSIVGGQIKVNGRRAGSTATYECALGYVLIGEDVLSCGLGGKWTEKPPVCRYVDCGTPARPDRGNLKILSNSTTVGAKVKYFCDEDYWLVGNDELVCTKEGKWSGNTPQCDCEY